MSVLLLDVEVESFATRVRLADGRIKSVGPDLSPRHGEDVVEGGGGALIPGLHDHHVHLRAMAAMASSVEVGPRTVMTPEGLAASLRSAPANEATSDWVRAVGYHDSVAGPLDRWTLDRLVAVRPVRVQHRSGALWILNSAAVAATDLERCCEAGVERDVTGTVTGRIWRMDRWLRTAVAPVVDRDRAQDLVAMSRALLSAGVTGVTDATPERPAEDLYDLVACAASGELTMRLHLMAPAETTLPGSAPATVSLGPVKLMLDDDTLPPLDDVIAMAHQAHAEERGLAVHCVTVTQLAFALAALEAAGSHVADRIEHAAVVPPDLLSQLAHGGPTVVTQPNFVAERGDRYLVEVDPRDQPYLYPAASLVRAGVRLAAGTDAPFGRPDPWAAIRSAIHRRTASGAPLGSNEALGPPAALALFTGRAGAPAVPRRVAAGELADLCLLAAPIAGVLADPDASAVRSTWVAGVAAHTT